MMKGTNILTVNSDQMKSIVQEWWNAGTYEPKLSGKVTSVNECSGGTFEIIFIEDIKTEDES